MLGPPLRWVIGLVACAAALGLPCGARTAEQEPAPTVQAIWKHQEITFSFQSFTIFYSCDGLKQKLERILRELGVRATVRIRSAKCTSAVAHMPRAIIKVTSPVEATPEALAERDRGRSRRELVARLRGTSEEEARALEQFPAQWHRVPLTRGALDLAPGDCELIEQVSRKILPKLAVRITEDDVRCAASQLSLNQPRLEVEVLMAMPRPDEPGRPGQSREKR